ncbi:hypothetical protein [Bacillus sp. OTU530]|uniref:hypothetical protein n=1 Tax=Bacillus sp. OTU530 TaxID=3043862 RepID=UPI00313B6FCA
MVGFHGYQVQSERAIRHFGIIAQFTYVFAMQLRKTAFSLAILETRARKMDNIIGFVYQVSTNVMSLEQIKKRGTGSIGYLSFPFGW